VVLAVDTTATPADKLQGVEIELNRFAQSLTSNWIDLRLAVLARQPGFCVPAPLGSGACSPQGADSLPPALFHHPSAVVDDGNALKVLIEEYPDVYSQIEPIGQSTLIVVTGGDATADPFTNAVLFGEMYSMVSSSRGYWKMSAYYPFTQCVPDVREGRVYRDIVTQTGGVHADICTESAQTAFARIAGSILDSLLPCAVTLPNSGEPRPVDFTKINVNLRTSGSLQTLVKVVSAADCDGQIGGWYYDNAEAPTRVILCPESCKQFRTTRDASLDIVQGCATIVYPGCP
jgi:hypothetical protein